MAAASGFFLTGFARLFQTDALEPAEEEQGLEHRHEGKERVRLGAVAQQPAHRAATAVCKRVGVFLFVCGECASTHVQAREMVGTVGGA